MVSLTLSLCGKQNSYRSGSNSNFIFIFDNLNWTSENFFFFFCQTGSKLFFINEPPCSIVLT